MVKTLQNAKRTIDLALFEITSEELTQALLDKLQEGVRGTIDTLKVGRLHNAQLRAAIGQCQMSRAVIGRESLKQHIQGVPVWAHLL